MKFRLLMFLVFTIFLVSCSSSKEKVGGHSDPFEGFNRSMYSLNYYVFDSYFVRPAAVAWRGYVPSFFRKGLSNFLQNLEEPAAMVNYFLLSDPYHGMIHFTRFFLNTFLGMGGCIDIAGMANSKLQSEKPRRFGNTLGYYGVGYGPYLHLPFYGSFTLRDDLGSMIDSLYPVLSCLTWPLFLGKWIIEGIETRSKLLGYDSFLYQSSDPYVVFRETYFQNHDFIAKHNQQKAITYPNIQVIENVLSEIDEE